MSNSLVATNRRFSFVDPIVLNRVEATMNQIFSSRGQMFRSQGQMDPRRDIYEECGFPKQISVEDYAAMWERNPIAARVVELLPKECWQIQPTVYEKEKGIASTPFEQAWDELGKGLRGEKSWFKDEEGSPVWEYLKRIDIMSGVGFYGVLLLGFDDKKPLDQPIEGAEVPGRKGQQLQPLGTDAQYWDYGQSETQQGKLGTTNLAIAPPQPGKPPASSQKSPPVDTEEPTDDAGDALPSESGPSAQPVKTKRKLLYMRPFNQSLVEIVRYDADRASPRYGQPIEYNITMLDPTTQQSGVGVPQATVRVHWTRVIHVADNLTASECFGVPRQHRVFNNLLSVDKLLSGSPEMFWMAAFQGLSLETHPQLGGDVNVDVSSLREMMENYKDTLQRYIVLQGMTAKPLAPMVSDPTPHIDKQIEAICILLGCPVRVFKGSERGELASSQDDSSWNDRLRERMNNYITPRLIVPLVDRLIAVGCLPEPEGYSVEWPDLEAMSDLDKATVASTNATAIATYVQSGSQAVLLPADFFVHILGWDEEKVKGIIEAAEEKAAADEAEAQKQMEDAMKQGLIPGAVGGPPVGQPGKPPIPGQKPPQLPGKPPAGVGGAGAAGKPVGVPGVGAPKPQGGEKPPFLK